MRAACAAWMALAWLAGVAWQLQQERLDGPGLNAAVALIALVAVISVVASGRLRASLAGTLGLAVAAAVLGYASTNWRAERALEGALAPALEGRDLLVTGVVDDLPHSSALGTQFVFATESASLDGRPVELPAQLALGWWRSGDEDLAIGGPGEALRAGQRWQLPLRLRAPHGPLNPQGFDLEMWFFERGLGASGSVRTAPGVQAVLLEADVGGHAISRWRQTVRERIDRQVGDPLAAGVLAALAVGDQAAIDSPGWALFRSTGVAHLMSISGLHVTMFAWLAGALIGRLWRGSPGLMLACPAPTAARLGGLVAAAGYAVFSGWGVPSQRTVWMIGVVVLLRSAGLAWPLPAVLLAAALGVTLVDPWAMLQPGFWLSFGAVALLIASEPVHGSQPDPPLPAAGLAHAGSPGSLVRLLARLSQAAVGGLRSQAVATIGLAPLSLICFQQLSLVGFAANSVAIPLVTLLITPLALLGVIVPPLWSLAAALVQALLAMLHALAALPLAQWTAAAAPPWAMACGLLAGLLAVMPLPWRLRACALPLVLPLLAPPVTRPAPGQFELVAADIGQGTAVLVRTREHLLLFDTGPQTSPESDAGSRVLLPLLRARGEPRIDLLMLSHRDGDHIGGAASVLAGIPVAAVSSSLEDGHPLLAGLAAGVAQGRCQGGQRWDWDGVQFELLRPPAADYGQALKSNAMSCVLRVHGNNGSALLTGDIESAQEAALLQAAVPLAADVLIVPHHGSRTSSSAAFIDAVRPQVAVVQAAYRSRFGHPAPEVVARYQDRGVTVVRSDRCGAWTWPAGSPAAEGRCERMTARRYWHHRVPGQTAAVLAPTAVGPTRPTLPTLP